MLCIQFWAPDDGRRTRLKHVEHFTEINTLCNVASCWLYLKIRMFSWWLKVCLLEKSQERALLFYLQFPADGYGAQFTLLCGAKNFLYCCVYSHSYGWCWLHVVVHTLARPLGGSSCCPPHHLNKNSLTCIAEACSAHITLLYKVHT
jgi:hypothetical protein